MQIAKILFIIISGAALLGGCGGRNAVVLGALTQANGALTQAKEDPLAALRGTPPPTGTKTEKYLREKDVWGGKLDVNARVKPEGWSGNNSHLYAAAHENDMEAARWLIANGAEVNAKTKYGNTPLAGAAGWNAAEVAKLLIANGAEVNAKNNKGATPLHFAAGENAAEVAEMLIAKGADVNVKNKKWKWGYTPLHWAARENAAEVAKLLIDNGADVNVKSKIGETPLHRAVWENAAEVAKLLIDNNAYVNAKNNYGSTPLDWAIVAGVEHADMQSLLRQHNGRCNKEC